MARPQAAYQQAIRDARAGRWDDALPVLRELVAAYPRNPAYRDDLIVVLSWSERHTEALQASQSMTLNARVPDYVLSALGKSALSGGQAARAAQAYSLLLQRRPRDTDAAQGLARAKQVVAAATTAAAAVPVTVAPASATPAALPQLATQVNTPVVAPAAPPLWDGAANQAVNAARIRTAMAALDQDFTTQRYAALDAALADNLQLTTQATAAGQASVARRLQLDRLVALQARGQSTQVVTEFLALDAAGLPMPPYAMNAAADAYLSLRQPEVARALYQRSMLAEGNPQAPNGTQMALMYAELEAENFPGVHAIVQQRLAATGRSPAARANAVAVLRFADRLPQADEALQQLSAEFPQDSGLWLTQADLLAQRGLPRAAEARYRDVLAQEPTHLKARVGVTRALWAQGDIVATAEQVARLQAEAPEHPAVVRLVQDWQRRQRPLLTSSVKRGWGAGSVAGNADLTLSSSLHAGQDDTGFQLFATHHLATAGWWWDAARQYRGEATHQRAGVGGEWTLRDLQAMLEVGTDVDNGRDLYLTASAGWQLSDALSLRARYESQTSDFPLKGRVPDVEPGEPTYLHSDKLTLGAAYRWNETRRVAADLASYRFNDGNQRQSLAASWTERLYSGEGRTLDLQTAGYTSRNSLRGRAYFNPSSDLALSATLTADWLTWRRYERSFNQRLSFTLGTYRQESGDIGNNQTYGGNAFYGLHYEHEWQWGPDRSLRYGIGTRRFPYDGKYETGHYVDATLVWRF